MKKIPVKIGWETILLIVLSFLFPLYSVYVEKDLIALLIILLAASFASMRIFGITYRINGNELIIRNSIFGSICIPIDKIRSIKKTKNPISSPAPYIFGRIEIYYNNGIIIISPKNFNELKNELLRMLNMRLFV